MLSDAQMISKLVKGHSTAESRWARFGPYYAMFPIEFACTVVSQYSQANDWVLDPFAGRGSSTFAAAALGRNGIGVEINPVGWLYGVVKLHPAPIEDVILRLSEILSISHQYVDSARNMDNFFCMCFSHDVLKFLLAARENLNWRNNNTDATLMAFILLYLHGKRGQSLSNQMPMTKSTSIDYSIEWWNDKNLASPPEIDIESFFTQRFKWRYRKGTSLFPNTTLILGDSTIELARLRANQENSHEIKLLFTSPPYYGVTNYFIDQWLRIWVLGGQPRPSILSDEKYKKRFASKVDYEELLDIVFGQCALMMAPTSTVYVRTDVRKFTLETTKKVLEKHFHDYSMISINNSCTKKSQTELLNNSSEKPCETDIILQRQ